MKYCFNIINDRLESSGYLYGYTGNVNTYQCEFDIQTDVTELSWFCVFKQEGKSYIQKIENNCCVIPEEVLITPAPLYVGCFGSDVNSVKRLSTNFVSFCVKPGAYSEGIAPEAPTPDLWETLVGKMVPYIGKNGNWYVYDMISEDYQDSGFCAIGKDGEDADNAFIVTVTLLEDGSVTTDKSLEDIKDAYDKGQIIQVRGITSEGYIVGTLSTITEQGCEFYVNSSDEGFMFINYSKSDDVWTVKVDLTEYATKEEVDEIASSAKSAVQTAYTAALMVDGVRNAVEQKQDKLTDEQIDDINDIGNIRDRLDESYPEYDFDETYTITEEEATATTWSRTEDLQGNPIKLSEMQVDFTIPSGEYTGVQYLYFYYEDPDHINGKAAMRVSEFAYQNATKERHIRTLCYKARKTFYAIKGYAWNNDDDYTAMQSTLGIRMNIGNFLKEPKPLMGLHFNVKDGFPVAGTTVRIRGKRINED